MTASDEAVLIVDDFLPEVAARRVREVFEQEDFEFVMSGRWNRVFALLDGCPLKGSEVFASPSQHISAPKTYPVGSGVDAFIEAVLDAEERVGGFLGRRGSRWTTFSVRPYIYPMGAGLSWHRDGDYAGAFIYYAHGHWEDDWGGELLIEEFPSDAKCDGWFIRPTPNRLVVLKGGVRHRISRVEPAAGANVRQTLTGFFSSDHLLASA